VSSEGTKAAQSDTHGTFFYFAVATPLALHSTCLLHANRWNIIDLICRYVRLRLLRKQVSLQWLVECFSCAIGRRCSFCDTSDHIHAIVSCIYTAMSGCCALLMCASSPSGVRRRHQKRPMPLAATTRFLDTSRLQWCERLVRLGGTCVSTRLVSLFACLFFVLPPRSSHSIVASPTLSSQIVSMYRIDHGKQ
jgi:hypothetical protein